MAKIKIIYIAPSKLNPYANNARVHSEAQIEEIMESINRYGFNDPVDVAGDIVMNGHGRVIAAVRLNLSEIPTIDLSHLSERQQRAYRLAHNKIALNSTWDAERLANELNDLVDLEVDVSGLGFNEQELDDMLRNKNFLPEEEVEAKEPEEETSTRKAKSKLVHTCPNCGTSFTA